MTDLREYRCAEYTVTAPSRCCLFCGSCTDVFWDYTHGPYGFVCDLDMDIERGVMGECDGFTEEGE